jgi:hypothetical protein
MQLMSVLGSWVMKRSTGMLGWLLVGQAGRFDVPTTSLPEMGPIVPLLE